MLLLTPSIRYFHYDQLVDMRSRHHLSITMKKNYGPYISLQQRYIRLQVPVCFCRVLLSNFAMNVKTKQMKITLSGSLGHIGKPLAQALVSKGHTVTVISSNADRQREIEAIGARSAIGTIKDTDFIASAFSGADAVFCMVPPANYFNQYLNLLDYYITSGNNYAKAILQTGVKKVVNLSSIGAHMKEGNGILQGTYHVEHILNELPSDVAITHIRPTEFYYNLLPQTQSAKANGFLVSNIEAEVTNSWVSPKDIASVIAEEITIPSSGRKVRYVASEELTYNELVSILGEAIGKPDLKWVTITDEQMKDGLVSAGMQPAIAAGMAEMYASINSGLLYEHYKLQKPETMGKVKIKDFSEDFAKAYQQL
ncbi:uncharacterized protein YbjT (DUF2867 family) [Dyadobacter jejuensis]|uniref:Uncharacterized protein YbjT (DUF2867 family) n=2 Tax=Dyadobacter jejuensis TaxID=1082580 RepID=A0A316AQ84_9BACT|nr:uncharacterized protein YbjT (DUF2867 family) [Dyadobacter jejuensis]